MLKGKKMFVRVLCLTMCLALALLAGCGGSDNASSAAPAGDSAAPSTTPDLGKVSIRISACNSLEHPQTLGLLVMKDYVEAKTGGNVSVEVFPNSQLGAERESVEQVKNGTLEMATASIGPITTFCDKFMVLDIPFMFDSYEEAWMVLDSEAGWDLFNQLEAENLKGLAWMENGFRHVTNSVKAINSVADFKGLKIRTMEAPMHMANFQALGANPTPVPFSELYMAMSQKIVDGQENPLANIWDLKMNEVQKYVTLSKHLYDSMPLVTNLEWYNKLPSEYQTVISEGALLGQNYSRFVNAAREEAIIAKLTDLGMEFNELSPEAKAEMVSISQTTVSDKVKAEIGEDYVNKFMDAMNAAKAEILLGVE